MQVGFHGGIPVAAVGSDHPGRASETVGDPGDRRSQLRRVDGVTELDGVVKDDPVSIVDDLGFIPELHGLAEPSLADRTGIDVMETDHPAGRIGHHPGQPAAGLGHHALCLSTIASDH